MKQLFFLSALTGAILLDGCGQQTKLNGEKIEVLSQKIIQLEQTQARQMAALQSQLTSLAPMLDRMNNSYFEKSHEDAFFFHTNTLYLLLTVDRKIEAQLQVADKEREADRSMGYYYHTNQTDTLYFCVAQIENAMEAQEIRLEDRMSAQNNLVITNLTDLGRQIKLSAPDEAELTRRKELAADIAQIKSDLAVIKAQLGITNPAAQTRP